jgi:hypothetical protein
MAERDTPVQAQGRGRGLEGAGRFGRLLAVVGATGARETGRLFLLLDQEDRHVRGFIPKASPGDLPPDAELGGMIREWITAGTSR